ncbi:uncharacterized protein VTP21DRAFT_7167 [Calcarisporiella thermophila]|uniref:uncharacterized protein n=1 Tax=Calcarisporiella thermophila TaxID=911321 RepID=UPI003743F14E
MIRNITLTLFSSKNCSLCVPVLETLRKLQTQIPFQLKVQDIYAKDCPRALRRKYKTEIPVVHIDQHYVLRHRIRDEGEFLQVLQDYIKNGKIEPIN